MHLSLPKTFFVMMMGLLPMYASAQNGGMVPPFAHGPSMTTDQALKAAPKEDVSLVPLAKAMTEAQTSYKKKPRDTKIRKSYVEATYKYAHAIMIDQGRMSPKIQYRAALALYRRILVVDPKHGPSLTEKKQIEDIYRGMGMPVPK